MVFSLFTNVWGRHRRAQSSFTPPQKTSVPWQPPPPQPDGAAHCPPRWTRLSGCLPRRGPHGVRPESGSPLRTFSGFVHRRRPCAPLDGRATLRLGLGRSAHAVTDVGPRLARLARPLPLVLLCRHGVLLGEPVQRGGRPRVTPAPLSERPPDRFRGDCTSSRPLQQCPRPQPVRVLPVLPVAVWQV